MIQHYAIKFVSDLQQVCGFLWILLFPPPIKLTATLNSKARKMSKIHLIQHITVSYTVLKGNDGVKQNVVYTLLIYTCSAFPYGHVAVISCFYLLCFALPFIHILNPWRAYHYLVDKQHAHLPSPEVFFTPKIGPVPPKL